MVLALNTLSSAPPCEATLISCSAPLDPDKLSEFDLTPSDVAQALREQNAQFAAGRIGAEPAPPKQAFTMTITTRGQLQTVEAFEKIILRAEDNGSLLRLRDVARVELGAQNYDFTATFNGEASVPTSIWAPQPMYSDTSKCRTTPSISSRKSARSHVRLCLNCFVQIVSGD